MKEKVDEFMKILDDEELAGDILSAVDARQKELDQKGVTSKDDDVLSKIKSLLGFETKEDPKPAPDVLSADTIKEIVSATVSSTIAAITAKEETQKEQKTDDDRKEQIDALTSRIDKLEGDVKDAETELSAAQKELKELVGDDGYRASQKEETVIAKKEETETETGLSDFIKRSTAGQ